MIYIQNNVQQKDHNKMSDIDFYAQERDLHSFTNKAGMVFLHKQSYNR